jgi:hypothetical protein
MRSRHRTRRDRHGGGASSRCGGGGAARLTGMRARLDIPGGHDTDRNRDVAGNTTHREHAFPRTHARETQRCQHVSTRASSAAWNIRPSAARGHVVDDPHSVVVRPRAQVQTSPRAPTTVVSSRAPLPMATDAAGSLHTVGGVRSTSVLSMSCLPVDKRSPTGAWLDTIVITRSMSHDVARPCGAAVISIRHTEPPARSPRPSGRHR